MEVNGQLNAPASLPFGKSTHSTYWVGRWVVTRILLDTVPKRRIGCPSREWNHGRSAPVFPQSRECLGQLRKCEFLKEIPEPWSRLCNFAHSSVVIVAVGWCDFRASLIDVSPIKLWSWHVLWNSCCRGRGGEAHAIFYTPDIGTVVFKNPCCDKFHSSQVSFVTSSCHFTYSRRRPAVWSVICLAFTCPRSCPEGLRGIFLPAPFNSIFLLFLSLCVFHTYSSGFHFIVNRKYKYLK
jgi:hypothetical protein